jgi:predicted esterase
MDTRDYIYVIFLFLAFRFDCYSFDISDRSEDEPGLNLAARHIDDIISTEVKDYNIPASQIIIGGISQGSAVSIFTALTTTHRLAGIFILSGYIPLRKKAKEACSLSIQLFAASSYCTMQIASPSAQSLPIFWAHGRADQQVEYKFSLDAAQTLASDLDMQFRSTPHPLNLDEFMMDGGTDGLRFVTYDRLGHWITPGEMKDLSMWMKACLARDKAVMRRPSIRKTIRDSYFVQACINRTRSWFNETSPQNTEPA